MIPLAHAIAAGLYLLAALLGVSALRRGHTGPAVAWWIAAAVAIHAWGFVSLHGQDPPVPLSSFPAALSLIGWLLAVSFLMSLRVARVRDVGAWVAGLTAGLTVLAALGLAARPSAPAPELSVGASSHAHVLLSTLGFSLLGLASLAGLAYLAKQRALKEHRTAPVALPSLESLDRLVHLTLSVGYPLLTLGVLTGFVWGASHDVSPWSGHALWLLVAWAVYLVPIGMLVLRRQHGDRPARGAVIGFALLAFSYIGIRLIGAGP
jgi:ABC-type uncharacterized transport system permease subunit